MRIQSVHHPKKVRFNLVNQIHHLTKTHPPTRESPVIQAALDSGASANCFPIGYKGTNHKLVAPGQATLAQVADDRIIASEATDELAIAALPPISKHVDKFKDISTPLLSVNKLCKGDLAVLFHGPKATVFKPAGPAVPVTGQTVMEGKLDQQTELYMVDVPTVPTAPTTPCKFREGTKSSIKHANAITFKSVPALINYYHLCLGAPPMKTWLSAINQGWPTSFPGLTAAQVNLYCNSKTQTAKGHLELQRQHIQSTTLRHRTKKHTISTHEVQDLKNILGMDGTGRYPITSASGMQYMLVFIDHNSNYI